MRYSFRIVRRSFCAVNVPLQTFWDGVRICHRFCRDLARDLSGKIQIWHGFGKGNGKEKTNSPEKKRNFAAKQKSSGGYHLGALWCRLYRLVQAPPGASRAGAVRICTKRKHAIQQSGFCSKAQKKAITIKMFFGSGSGLLLYLGILFLFLVFLFCLRTIVLRTTPHPRTFCYPVKTATPFCP